MRAYDVVWVWENDSWNAHEPSPENPIDSIFRAMNNAGKLAYKGLKLVGPPECSGPVSCNWCSVVAK
jgi:hypothetical protein